MARNVKKIFFSIFVLLGLFLLLKINATDVLAAVCSLENINSCNDTNCLNEVKKQCNSDLEKTHNQANTLKNQIAQFNSQIYLTTLKITETQNKIQLLGGRIDQLEVSLKDLTTAFSSRAVETYKLSKFENTFAFLLAATDINDAVDRFHYLQKIQAADQSLLEKLQEAQTIYQDEKQSQEDLQKELEIEKASLNSQKAAKDQLLAQTQGSEANYQKLLNQAEAQLAKFKSFVESHGGSSPLDNQTKCNEGWTGCYYNQRDKEWAYLPLGNSGYLMKDSGCFATSVAMLASHSNKNIRPNDIANSPDAITPGGDVVHNFSVNGVNVHIDNANESTLDSHLASGPVMAELNGGAHFIVILRKDGDAYIMNDPFLKDGYNKPLSAGGYSVSSITGLRIVSFN